ncbi:MAG TPA: aminotransferase class V-fold PLP-dependent enzyme [Pyrinomonadaceae bacterium]|nr:aminotransferase class V-fold PLP-dependent enzyme [Pyrinomonadaceae bacterium]
MSHSFDERDEGQVNAASLDLADEDLRELAAGFVELTTDYFRRVSEMPVFPQTNSDEIARRLHQPLPLEPQPLAHLIEDSRTLINLGRQNGHPRMYGYIASPSTPAGAFANLLASAISQNVTTWRSAPGATTIEHQVVGWLAEMTGFSETGSARDAGAPGGLLTSGGSMANLNALFVALRTKAREWQRPDGQELSLSAQGLWNVGAPATLYTSDQTHLSVPKAADFIGLGREQVRLVPSDADFKLDVRLLREMIEADLARGLRPFCVVANAGTVSTGAIDPLADVARVARDYGLWFHVDGAYGALAALDASKRPLLSGVAHADSLSLDPHKWLYTPVGCGCLLLRSPARSRMAYSGGEDAYIKVYEEREAETFAFWDYGIELSRPFRALPIWLMLRYYGVRRVAAAIAKDNALAAYMAERVSAAEDLELLAPVTLGICCFRYVPTADRQALAGASREERDEINVRLDDLNARIMRRVQRGGAAYVSNASLRGRFSLRASITNFRTTRRDIDATLDTVRRAGIEEGRSNKGKA